jgi:deoxyribose-phosphate aldolase
MRAYTPAHVQVKAAGGVRTLDRLLEVRALGVSRCGATATIAILDECRERLGLAPIGAVLDRPGSTTY